MTNFPSLPQEASLLDLFKRFPGLGKVLAPCNHYVMRGPSPFSEEERELIATYVSTINACDYCAGSHGEVAKAFGVPEETIALLATDVDSAPVDEKLRPVLKFVEKLTRSPARITTADAEAVLAAGWSEEALFSAVTVCCVFNFMNRLVEGSGLPASEQQAVTGGRLLFEKGYAGVPAAAGISPD